MLINQPIRRIAHDYDRRWMSDDFFDLVVWYEPCGPVHGFQLCYDKAGRERSFTWTRRQGFNHALVDTGESDPNANRTPVLKAASGQSFPFDLVAREFMRRSLKMDPHLRELVLDRMIEYGRRFVPGAAS